jgi:hypothetical protein
MVLLWLIFDVNPFLRLLNCVDVGEVSCVSEVYAASNVRVNHLTSEKSAATHISTRCNNLR